MELINAALPPIPCATLTETVTPGPKQRRDPIVAASAAASRLLHYHSGTTGLLRLAQRITAQNVADFS